MHEEVRLFYLCSENKGTDQLCDYPQLICALVFTYAKSRLSHDAAGSRRILLSRWYSLCLPVKHINEQL